MHSEKEILLHQAKVLTSASQELINKVQKGNIHQKSKLCLYTATGKFTGTPLIYNDDDINNAHPMQELSGNNTYKLDPLYILQLKDKDVDRIPKEEQVKHDGAVIILEQAVFESTSTERVINMDYAYIFVDEIVAFQLIVETND